MADRDREGWKRLSPASEPESQRVRGMPRGAPGLPLDSWPRLGTVKDNREVVWGRPKTMLAVGAVSG